MIFTINGNLCRIYIPANELSDGHITLDMPDGYTYKTILIIGKNNVNELNAYMPIVLGADYTFPIVNYRSPSTISLYVPSTDADAELRFIIKEFGQIPDRNYFNTTFDPILVTDSYGNEYNVIPSDQFK